ncbi:MAG: hypothetical protein J7L12_01010 [Desulfurococcales archaeon]|nr:hypothetical protein [Desulfurococcales archaeon]
MITTKLTKTLFGYIRLETNVEDAVKILNYLKNAGGRDTEDVNDALRIIKNFDVFYEMMKKKFKDYIAPRKSEVDLIRGRVVIDKIRLSKNDVKKVTIIFDKRVGEELITKALEDLGIKYELESET